jgi:hypothetical protein
MLLFQCVRWNIPHCKINSVRQEIFGRSIQHVNLNLFMKAVISGVWFVLSVSTTLAQENFVRGTAITVQGDTIRGMIDDQRWKYSPPFIVMKNDQGEVHSYYPQDLQEFRLSGKAVFRSDEVAYDSSGNHMGSLSTKSGPALKRERVFLRYITKGEVSLLSLVTSNGTHFFLLKDNAIESLIYHRYLITYNGQSVIRENRFYVTQVRARLQDHGPLEVSDRLPYTSTALADLCQKYNDRGTAPQSERFTSEKMIASFGLSFTTGYDKFRKGYHGGLGYSAGLSGSLKLPNNNYRWEIYTNLSYRKTAHQSGYISDLNQVYAESFEIQSIEWTIIPRLRLTQKNSNFFIGVGATFTGGLRDKYGWTKNSQYTLLGKKGLPNNALVMEIGCRPGPFSALSLRFENGGSYNFDDFHQYTGTTGYSSLRLAYEVYFKKRKG